MPCFAVRRAMMFIFLMAQCLLATADITVPTMPETAAQARPLLTNLENLQNRERYKIDLQEQLCYDKTLISMCLSDVRSQRSTLIRAFRKIENHARDLVRIDDFETRRKIREAETLKAIENAPATEAKQKINADSYQKRQREPGDQLPPQPVRRKEIPQIDSGLSVQEQTANRTAYEQKLKEAANRRRVNDERLQELEKKRAKVRLEQTQP